MNDSSRGVIGEEGGRCQVSECCAIYVCPFVHKKDGKDIIRYA